jgi:hypothetical protein
MDSEDKPPSSRQFECVRAVLDTASNLKLLALEFSPDDYRSECVASLARAWVMGKVDGMLTSGRPAFSIEEYLVFTSASCPGAFRIAEGMEPFLF